MTTLLQQLRQEGPGLRVGGRRFRPGDLVRVRTGWMKGQVGIVADEGPEVLFPNGFWRVTGPDWDLELVEETGRV